MESPIKGHFEGVSVVLCNKMKFGRFELFKTATGENIFGPLLHVEWVSFILQSVHYDHDFTVLVYTSALQVTTYMSDKYQLMDIQSGLRVSRSAYPTTCCDIISTWLHS